MKLIVDQAQRYAKMRAHTAAHLLHATLGTIFSETKQAWSFVDEDYLRLDFATDRALTNQELSDIQKKINYYIYAALPVENFETSYDEAINLGAKAFFEDKYGDKVRVVKVDQDVSIELCGGTHVTNTKDIGCFVILAQESVASGIKRIVALTGPKVFEYIQEKDKTLDSIAEKFGVTQKQVVDKTEKLLKDHDVLQNAYGQLENKLVADTLRNLPNKNNNSELQFVLEIPSDMNFKTALGQARKIFENQNFLIYTKEWNFALFMTTWSAKTFSQNLSLKWGWSDQLVQWRDPKIATLF